MVSAHTLLLLSPLCVSFSRNNTVSAIHKDEEAHSLPHHVLLDISKAKTYHIQTPSVLSGDGPLVTSCCSWLLPCLAWTYIQLHRKYVNWRKENKNIGKKVHSISSFKLYFPCKSDWRKKFKSEKNNPEFVSNHRACQTSLSGMLLIRI